MTESRKDRGADRDAQIFAAAREVLSLDPRASMSSVAAAAGVGMSALYKRYPSKAALLDALVEDVVSTYELELARAHESLDSGAGATEVLEAFVRGLLAGGAASISPRAPSVASADLEQRRWEALTRRNRALFERLQRAQAVREGITFHDFGLLISAVGSIRGASQDRTHDLQQRLVRVLLDGLRADLPPLAGEGAARHDFYDLTTSGDASGPPRPGARLGRS